MNEIFICFSLVKVVNCLLHNDWALGSDWQTNLLSPWEGIHAEEVGDDVTNGKSVGHQPILAILP